MAQLEVWCRVTLIGPDGTLLGAWPVRGEGNPGMPVVDEVARLKLVAGRLGVKVLLENPATELLELLELSGLPVEVKGTPGKVSMVDDSDAHTSVGKSYDEVAEDYRSHLERELDYKPLDRALLGAVVEQVEAGFPVADLGCGPGHVAAWLASRGARCVGIDLSEQMVAIGRRDHPDVEFRQGDLVALPADDEEFGAVVALYSIIHLERGELDRAFAEIFRTLRPSGIALVSFHVGSEVRHRTEWWGHDVDIDFRFYEPREVVDRLESSGLSVEAKLERTNYPDEAGTRRAYLFARRAPLRSPGGS